MGLSNMINQSNKQMEELQLLSTVDPTGRLEYELLDRDGERRSEEEDKQDPGRRCRLSFSLAVRKGRFARYSLLIGSRYGVWSAAERRFIKRTNFYHYHHITQGIRDAREFYVGVFMDGFYNIHTVPALLYKFLFVHPRRAVQIIRALLFYYHVFLAKNHHMECWPDDLHGKDRREELTSMRHRLVDVYWRRMSPAQRRRVLVTYQRDRRDLICFFGLIFLVMLMLFAIIAWLLNYYW